MRELTSSLPVSPRAWLAGAAALLLAAALALPATVRAQAAAPAAPAASAPGKVLPPHGSYTPKGADTCLSCHDEDSDKPGFSTAAVFKSRHAHRGDKRAPFGAGGLQCEACHGPGGRHAVDGKELDTFNSFAAKSKRSAAERSEPCLACHQGRARNGWHAGAHAREDLACNDCHKLHRQTDPILTKAGEPDVCFSCHRQQRTDFLKTSSHPLRHGLMGCSDCHNAHGGGGTTAALVKPTVNQTCTTCHAEKRGPLLWEHAPVTEDCKLCHTPHGSVRQALLTKSTPLLCQQCHSVAGHPAVARTGAALPGGGAGGGGIFLIAGSCTNCHSQVHGSNHPSGAKLMR